jgi:YVTN family beta-propeller protein
MRKALIGIPAIAALALVAQQSQLFPVLKSTVLLGKQPGFYLVANNQLLRPWGELTTIPGRPVDMTFDSQHRLLAVLNTRALLLLDPNTGVTLGQVTARSTSYAGIAFRPGDRELWASETSRNGTDAILIAPLDEWGKPGEPARIELKGHPLPVGIAFAPDGKTAYVALSRNNTLAVIDTATRTIKEEIPTGLAPFGVAATGDRVFVTNRAGRRPDTGEPSAPSSGTMILSDPVTGSSRSGSLSVLDVKTGKMRDVAVGLAPSQMAMSPGDDLIAVTNGHSDSVSLVRTATLDRTDIKIPTYPDTAFGSQPIAAAFSADGKRLYVACGGNNSIVVLEPAGKQWKVAGAVPTAWFPTAIAVQGDGSLRVLNLKGVGNTQRKEGTFSSLVYEGALERIPAPLPAQIAAGTREVRAANSPVLETAGGVANLPSLGIQHVFLIIKENRTYDQVFGDMGKGNSDPKLTMYGRDITPNHHALAEKYVLLDNFYTGGAISFDGHQWLMQGFVSDYVERAFAASPRGYAYNMADALVVAPTGFFWQAAPKPLSIRLYGECQVAGRWDPAKENSVDMNESDDLSWTAYWQAYKEGRWQGMVGARCGVPALAQYSSKRYPYSTLAINDQIRAEEFIREFNEREKANDIPQLSILSLNSDHTNGTRPGSPTPRAMVADDDLALGRIVERISHSPIWKDSLILVTEDDAQNGVDHVDGHRTIGLAIGPHVRRNAVDSNNYNHTGMIRTIQEIFRVPQRTRAYQNARAMTSIFAAEANTEPYQRLESKVPLDEMNAPLKALNGRQLWGAKQSLAMNFKDIDDVPYDTLNRILWWDAKGWNTPYPAQK